MANMIPNINNTDLCDARDLSQKLWVQYRDAEGAFQTLAVDLRKLRNVLEDIVETTPQGSHERTFASQVAQCKAILLSLDLTLQSVHCQEQQNSQPRSVLAGKASVQIMTNCLVYALVNTSVCSRQEVLLTHDIPAEGGAVRCLTQSNASNDDAQSTDTSSAATNTTSSNRSSAKIVGLESNQLPKTSVISLQAIVNGKRALKPIPYPDATSAWAGIDWRPPFSPSDSISSNGTKAHEPLTKRFIKSPPNIPRITIRGCDNETPETTDYMLEDSSSSDTYRSKSSHNSDRSEYQPGSTTHTTSQIDRLQPGCSNASPTAQVYVPYRPWYRASESPSFVSNKPHDSINEDEKFALREFNNKQRKTRLTDEASLEPATGILLAEPPPIVRCDGAKYQPHGQTETTQAVPLMPACPPPRPPITRHKRKPPVPPPRRRLLRDVNPFLSAEESCSSTSTPPAPTQVASSVGSQARFSAVTHIVLPLLVSLQDVLDRSLSIRQRASIGDLAIGTTHTHSKANHRRGHPSPEVDMRLCQPASTPKLKAFGRRPTIPPAVSELRVKVSSLLAEDHTTVRFSGESCDIRGVLQDQRALETKRIRDICESFNRRQRAKVEAYLTYHLSPLKASTNSECTRRTRHILGACASYRGHSRRIAITVSAAFFEGAHNNSNENSNNHDGNKRLTS